MSFGFYGTDIGSLYAATRLINAGVPGESIHFYDHRPNVGGLILTTDGCDYGGLFIQKPWIFPYIEAGMQIWSEGKYAELFEAVDDGEASPSGPTLYFGRDGRKLDTDEVEAGLAVLRRDYVPALCGAIGLSEFNQFQLTPQQEFIQRMSVAQWLNAEPIPGVRIAFPKVSSEAVEILGILSDHDNGVPLHRQNLLHLLLMFNARGVGYFTPGSTVVVKGGGSTVVDRAADWLTRRGVTFELNCPAEVRDPEDPSMHFSDGSKREFTRLFVSSIHHECLQDPMLQMGRALFWNIQLKPEFARAQQSWDTNSPAAETWQSMLRRDVLVAYVGGSGYEGASEAPPFAALESALPGITGNVLSQKTVNWPKRELNGGTFSFLAPGDFQFIPRRLQRSMTRKVSFIGEALSAHAPGYPDGACEVAEQVIDAQLASL